MTTSTFSNCRGQATSEFLVAMVVLIPLFLGIAYAARYLDIQHAAVQASRYAAFQRVMQPDAAKLTNAELEDKIRARFFLSGDFAHGGRLQSDDSVASLADGTGHVALWHDMAFGRLLTDHKQVSLAFTNESLHDDLGSLVSLSSAGSSLYGKSSRGIQVANVEVNLVNRFDLAATAPAALKIGATTAAAGGAWNTEGSGATKASIKHNVTNVPSAVIPSSVSSALNLVLLLFEDSGPELGCIKTDVVPSDRLTAYTPQDC